MTSPRTGPCESPNPYVVYRLLDDEGRLLYVGMSTRIWQRLAQHSFKAWNDSVSRVELVRFAQRVVALQAEAHAIRTENPVHNRSVPPPNGHGRFTVDRSVIHDDGLVYVGEIARAFRVDPGTPHSWRRRSDFPTPRIVRGAKSMWYWPDVEAWARDTGRLVEEDSIQ